MNTQPIEHSSRKAIIEVHEIFDTIQGEGPFAGEPAIFVRLTGCNLQCPQCDTDYTSRRRYYEPGMLVHAIQSLNPNRKFVVITGGEPFRQYALGTFVNILLANGYKVQIETNGTRYVPGPWAAVTIVCSPKTPKLDQRLVPWITSYKYVVQYDWIGPDGLPTWTMGKLEGKQVARPPQGFNGTIFIQPLDEKYTGKNDLNMQAAVRVCQQFGYRLCLQLHKIAGLD